PPALRAIRQSLDQRSRSSRSFLVIPPRLLYRACGFHDALRQLQWANVRNGSKTGKARTEHNRPAWPSKSGHPADAKCVARGKARIFDPAIERIFRTAKLARQHKRNRARIVVRRKMPDHRSVFLIRDIVPPAIGEP